MSDKEDLIPVRALNQVTYCRRLYYLEYVESVMPINEHVEDGLFQHRRVDDPDLQNRPRKDGDAVHTRSLQLSSERLGLTGKLDLVEEKDGSLYPVEYKRGDGPGGNNGRPDFWDNDAVQLCAQAMLLEDERGISIPFGVLYYIGSKRRVEVPLNDELRAKTLQAIRSIRELSLLDTPPEPLPAELRHRCFGCSLATICQPEETLYCLERRILTPAEETATGITRVLPQGSEGAVLYLQEQGAYVSKRSEHLVVKKHGAGNPTCADCRCPPGRDLRQRPDFDAGDRHPGNTRRSLDFLDDVWTLRRSDDADDQQECALARQPVQAVC